MPFIIISVSAVVVLTLFATSCILIRKKRKNKAKSLPYHMRRASDDPEKIPNYHNPLYSLRDDQVPDYDSDEEQNNTLNSTITSNDRQTLLNADTEEIDSLADFELSEDAYGAYVNPNFDDDEKSLLSSLEHDYSWYHLSSGSRYQDKEAINRSKKQVDGNIYDRLVNYAYRQI